MTRLHRLVKSSQRHIQIQVQPESKTKSGLEFPYFTSTSIHTHRRTLQHTLVLFALLLSNIIQIAHSSRKSDFPPLTDKLIASDIRQIKKELPDYRRPDFKQIPYLIQRVNLDAGITEYLFPPVEPGQQNAQVAFSRKFIDTHLSVLVFHTGANKWKKQVPRKYVILRRHSKQTPLYFLSFAYVRQDGGMKKIEWEVEELDRSRDKTKIEREICRGEDCDLPEWILGTCQVIQQNCTITLKQQETDTILRRLKTEEQDEDSTEALSFQDSESGSESGSSEEDFTAVLMRRRRRSSDSLPSLKRVVKSAPNVPSSLDLLFLDMPGKTHTSINLSNKSSTATNAKEKKKKSPSAAENRGVGAPIEAEENVADSKTDVRRSVIEIEHNIEEILHILKCRDCQKLGNFYEDLEEEVSFNRVLGEKLRQQFNSTKPKHNKRFPWMKRSKNLPYVGYGECAYMMEQPTILKPISNEMDDVIDFYLDTLRLDCDNTLKNEIRGWLTSKMRFVRIVQDLSFEFIPNCKLLQYKMLTAQEFETVVSALLFTKYSSVYREESTSQTPSRLKLLGHPLSAKVSFLTRVFIKIIDSINKYLKHHIIKISKALSRILKDKFYALLVAKNFIHLKKASRQGHQHKENYRDRIQIMALKEFVLYGLNPIFRSGTPTEVAFKSFYQLNENRIRFLVHTYGFDSPKNPK